MRLKIMWIPPGPGNIYDSIFNELHKLRPCWNLVMVCPICAKKCEKPLFKPIYLSLKENKYIFFPNIIYNKIKGLNSNDTTRLMQLKGITKTFREERPDIIISNLEYSAYTWNAATYCKRNKIPFILQTETQRLEQKLHKIAYYFLILLKRFVFTTPKIITAWTPDGVTFVKKNFPRIADKKVQLLPAGIDTTIFRQTSRKRNNKEIKLLVNARLVPYKRHIDVLNAMKKILSTTKIHLSLSILGSGILEEEIKSEIKKLSLDKYVNFLKQTPYNELYKVYSNHDILILPSYNDAIGMVVPEAMACGVPCLVSDTCGAKMYVENGVNGYIFKTYSSEDLAKKIILLKDAKKRELFGNRASAHIKKNFSTKIIAKKLEKLIVFSTTRNLNSEN